MYVCSPMVGLEVYRIRGVAGSVFEVQVLMGPTALEPSAGHWISSRTRDRGRALIRVRAGMSGPWNLG